MKAPPLAPAALGAILLAEGYASLATEILALRRMVPWAGSAVSVTAVLLVVYLAALAGGYRRGGRLARSRLLDRGSLYVNFLAWPEDALFRTRAERTLRSVFADCSAWPVAIEQGRGWHEALSVPGNLLLRCQESDLD